MQLTSEMPLEVQYRVPQQHGACIAVPNLSSVPSLISENQHRLAALHTESIAIANRSLSSLREMAQIELLRGATAYTDQYANPTSQLPRSASPEAIAGPIIMTGHQPELFHPGVWVKNFAASALAAQQQGTAINLLVDNDVVSSAAVQIPRLDDQGQPHLVYCPIDAHFDPVPYEQRNIVDSQLFESFGHRAAAMIQPIVPNSIVEHIWPWAVRSASRHGNLGRAIAESRHRLELEFGLRTLEIPLSIVCGTESFREFASHLINDLPQFKITYNQAILDYRRGHRLRGNSHPAPLLTSEGQDIESPFWIWSATAAERKPLVIRFTGKRVELLHGWKGVTVGHAAADSPESLTATLAALDAKGMCVRPRALITTLYSRLVLCDLFIHGIGGGKYDQVTNAIIRNYFHLPIPGFMVMSATFRLPFQTVPIQADDIRQVDGLLRTLWYHPECNAEQVDESLLDAYQRLATQKRALLRSKPRTNAKSWHRQIESVNRELRGFFASTYEELQVERNRLVGLQRAGKIISSREFSLCLFPINGLRRELLSLVENNCKSPLDPATGQE